MSLLPIIFRDMERPLRMLEQQMRMAEEFYPHMADRNQRSALDLISHHHDTITHEKEKFQAKLDIKQFTPEEIIVKTSDGNVIQVEAKHETKDEKGCVSRRMFRQMIVPECYDIKGVETKLSHDGILTLSAPSKNPKEALQDRVIPVTHVKDL